MSFSPVNPYVLAPMTTYSSQPDGHLSPDEEPYLERRARGGFGTIITAACAVHPSGRAFHGQWACWDDEFIPSLKRAADAIHRGNPECVALLQIHHGGRSCAPGLPKGGSLAPSAIAAERPNATIPREMNDVEIVRSISDYAQSARRAIEAGFDGVEIHGANTYLIQQFVSPQSNRRTDRWNADDLLFPIEVSQRVRQAVGEGPVVGYRFSPEEPETPGIRLDRTDRLIEALIRTEALDYLHVSLRRYDQPSLHSEEQVLPHVSGQIAGRLPLIGVGEIKSREDAAAALSAGADMVAIGRAGVSDPEWVFHVKSGVATRSALPTDDWAEKCTIPEGLARKIEATPGWFASEEPAEA